MWTPAHQKLLEVLETSSVLPLVREALEVPEGSEAADWDLIDALRCDPVTLPGLRALRHDPDLLRSSVEEAWPTALTPRLLHHLALLRLSGARRETGLLGMFWLWERHRSVYLAEIARAAAGDSKPLDEALEGLPEKLLAPENQALDHLGILSDEGASSLLAWKHLSNLKRGLLRLDLNESIARLEMLSEAAAQRAVERVIVYDALALQQSEAASVEKKIYGIGKLFGGSVALAKAIGHREKLTLKIIEWTISFAWELYRGDQMDALGILTRRARSFADDLEARLNAGDAFGHQSTFGDLMLLRSFGCNNDEVRQALLRRGHKQSPLHRNIRVSLASSNLRLASTMLNNLKGILRPRDADVFRENFEKSSAWIEEAERLRSDHGDLSGAKKLLEQARKFLR